MDFAMEEKDNLESGQDDSEMGIDLRECGEKENLEPLLRNCSERRSRGRLPTSPSATSLAAIAEQIARNEADRKIPKIRIPSYSSGLNTLSYGEPADYNVFNLTIPENYDSSNAFNLTIPDQKVSAGSTPGSTPSPLPNMNIVGPVCRWRRSDRRLRRLNTELLDAVEIKNFKWAEKSLNNGASPNATCRLDYVTACHIAAVTGSDEILAMLIERGADRTRADRMGRTPLHMAAWCGHRKCVAILLNLPHELQEQVDGSLDKIEKELRTFCKDIQENVVNVQCKKVEGKLQLPKEWKDSFDHDCKDIKDTIPLIGEGWTPLHVAAARARPHSTRMLLLAGANVHALDDRSRTPLDVLGAAHYHYPDEVQASEFLEVLRLLIKAGASHQTMRPGGEGDPATPLHTAIELESSDSVRELLAAGAFPGAFDDTGDTPLHTCVRRRLVEPLQILVNTWSTHVDPFPQTADLKNKRGYTALQTAVTEEWIPGVSATLEAGADVAAQSNDGETAIHAAAALGNLDLLLEILSVAKRKEAIDCSNASGETALFKAIATGHVECVRALMSEGASVTKMMQGGVTAIHRAAEFGFREILYELLVADKKNPDGSTIDLLSDEKQQGFGAIHYAAYNGQANCVKLLLSNGANIRLRTTPRPHGELTALHIASMLGHTSVAEVILAFDKYTIHEVDGYGKLPIHTAAHHGSRETIPLLLQAGSDLSTATGMGGPKKAKRTAIDMLVNNMTRPADYLEDLFDSYISVNGLSLEDSNCEVHVDYSVLMPKNCEMEQMKVIVALLKTGNRYDQKRLLLHPLVESFLYLKWKALSPFFYGILACYAVFVAALTCLVVSIFYYEDTKVRAPPVLDVVVWSYVMMISIVIIFLQELLYLRQNTGRYLLKLETWVKFGSISLSATLPFIRTYTDTHEWPRHIATLAVLLAWTELMFLLSRFPNWGYYVLMFAKVAENVIKILLTFAFLVIGFSLSFMIQFRSQIPFDGPWASLVKTIVMMTSEFDYVALFDDEHTKDLETSLLVGRIVFVAFLILAAIVLMNLMVGVAVSDINDLEILGNIQRLAKQVEFLGTLDVLVYNRFFSKVLPRRLNTSIRGKRNVANKLIIYPGRPRWKHDKFIPTKIKDAIFMKATKQKMINDEALALKNFSRLIDDIHEATVKRQPPPAPSEMPEVRPRIEDTRRKHQMRHDEIVNLIGNVSSELSETKEKMNEISHDTHSPIKDINRKLDCMHNEIDYLGTTLKKVMAKLDALAAAQGIQSVPPSTT